MMLYKIYKHSFIEHDSSSNLISYEDYNISLGTVSVLNKALENFVKSLDIHSVKGGISRTITALVTMIADLNLRVNSLKGSMIIPIIFVVEFADDGAPESKEKTMTIATVSL